MSVSSPKPVASSTDLRDDVLRRLLAASESDLTLDQLDGEVSLRDDLDMTSLESLNLVIDIEEHYGIDIEDDELAALRTVGDLLSLIDTKQPRPSKTA